MSGTLINVVTIIIGSILGLLLKKGIDKKIENNLIKAVGLAVSIIGILGVITSSIIVDGNILKSSNELLLIISLAIGTIIGELLKIDDRFNNIGKYIEQRYKLGDFSKGFVDASIIYCAGAMAVFGPIANVIDNDNSVLLVKSLLDGIVSIVLSSSLGIGVLFSSITVFIYQGFFAISAIYLNQYITVEIMNSISMVGYAIIITIGINQMGLAKIKTANLIPALIVPVIYFTIQAYL